MHGRALLAALVCGSVSGLARAENPGGGAGVASNATDGAQIVVAASPISAWERVSPDGADTVIIGRSQLERLNATDLPTALRQIPGVTISRYGPVGAYGGAQGGSVYIRGAGTARPGSEIKIYTEGVPRESGVWSHPLMDIAPVAFADEVRIARNPQPQRYPGAFGAVDMTLRRRREPGREAEGRLVYGRHQTTLGDLAAGGKEGLFDYYVGLAAGVSDGARVHSRAELWNLYLRAGWELTPEDTLAYLYQRTDNAVEDPGPTGAPPPRRDRFDTCTDTHILRWDRTGERLRGYVLLYFEDGAIRWNKDHLNDTPVSPPGHSNTDWRNYGFRSSFDAVFGRLTATAALDVWSEGGETRNIPEATGVRVWGYSGRFATLAPYAGLRYAQPLGEEWTVTPSLGARYYHSSEFDDAWAPCAALTAERGGLQLFVSHARGVHYPGIYVRGTSPRTWRGLDAETLDTTEAGVRLEVGSLAALHASLYRAAVRNRMETTAAGLLNTGDATSDGGELTARLYPTKSLTLFAGAAYAHPRTRPVSRMPDLTFSAGASVRLTRHLRWDADCEYVATQYAYSMRTPEPVLQKLDDFFVLNTRLALDLQTVSSLHGELSLALENLGDTTYAYFPGYPMPGLLAYAGVKVRFW